MSQSFIITMKNEANKLLTIAFIALLTCRTANATDSDTDLLTDNAIELLSSKWGNATPGKNALPALTTSAKVLKISDKARVANVESNGHRGFVLYSGNASEPVMIGYGLTDTLDITNLPPEASYFISCYSEAVAAASLSPTTQNGNTYPLPTIAPVEPFIMTKWGQEAPFNAKCPQYQGKPSVTGCVATALGQVLHYYRADNFNDYTIEYADSKSLAEVSVSFGDKHFDYDNMLLEYVDGQYSQQQAEAVAEMMYAIGASAKTEWTDTKSSAQWPLVSLDKYFNINATFLLRKALPTAFWMKKIQENLAAGKPILYTGAGVSSSKWSQHIFILDGIDENNYVHVNWGWAGMADGYYDITFCHPSIFGDKEDGYYSDQKMICDITPRKNGEKYNARFICTSGTNIIDLNHSHYSLEGAFTGYTTNSYESIADFTAKIIAVKGADVTPLGAADHYYLKQFPSWGYISWGADSYAKPYSDHPLSDGEYELMIATYNYDTDQLISYEPLPMRPYFVISDGYFTERGYKDYPEGKPSGYDETDFLSFDEFTPLYDVIAKAPFVARIRTHSLISAIGADDVSSKDLIFTNTETGKKYTTGSSITIYNLSYSGLHYEGYAMIEPPTNADNGFMMPAGRYLLSTSDDRIVFPDPIYVDVAPEVDYPVLQYDIDGTLMLSSWNSTYYYKKWGERLQIRRNNNYKALITSNNCYNPVKVNVYARKPDQNKSDELLVSTFDFDPSTGLKGLDFDLPGNLYPLEGEYMFYMRYSTPGGEKDILPLNGIFRLNEVREKYESMTLPTLHGIVADLSADIQMLQSSEAILAGNTISFKIKNTGNSDFTGNVIVRMCDSGNGSLTEYTAVNVSLAPDEQKSLSVDVTADVNSAYDTYILSQATTSRNASSDYTFATKEDGSVARYRMGADSGIGNTAVDKGQISVSVSDGVIYVAGASDSDTVSIYNIDGQLIKATGDKVIPSLPRGLYIVKVNESISKVVL